jgi:hypothetical protein
MLHIMCLGVLDTTQIMAAPSVLLKLLESLQEVWEESSWSSKWGGVGFGVMGEQGAESIHAEFNKIEQRHRNQRHDRVERLDG